MNIENRQFGVNSYAGIGTWAVVFGICLYWLGGSAPAEISANTRPIVICFLLYLTCFVANACTPRLFAGFRVQQVILSLQLLASYAVMWFLPVEFISILTIIWASMLPRFFSLKTSVLIALLVVFSWFVVFWLHWQKGVFFDGLLFSTFHLFAILMTQHAKDAEQASAKTLRLNRELEATQKLLAEASRQNERTRIARDLHDLLGHHLTALIINLQVASHLTEGDAKAKVVQCHSLAKLLLSDVREAVTTLRENHPLNFGEMVDLMVNNVPNLIVNSSIDRCLNLNDLALAKTLLSCIQEAISNSLRHSGASEFWIVIKGVGDTLLLELVDNGQTHGIVEKGNGLLGMTERVEELAGNLTIGRVKNAMSINITIPMPNHISESC